MTTTAAREFHGRTGHHSELAKEIEAAGYEVAMDTDDNELSHVLRPGAEDFARRLLGEIRGDADARVEIY